MKTHHSKPDPATRSASEAGSRARAGSGGATHDDAPRRMVNASPRISALESAIQLTRQTSADPRSAEVISRSDQSVPVQRKRDRLAELAAFVSASPAPSIHEAAARGVQTPSGTLPFANTIQPLFGRHALTTVQAHVGGAATESADAMQAKAFASGNHIVFGGAPDLATAAHEAAHVIQQRAGVHLSGNVGQEGDAYERHADAVAAKVVSGQSAEALLDRFAPRAAGASHSVGPADSVQRVRENIAPLPKDAVTVAALEALAAAVVQQVADLDPTESGWGFIDFAALNVELDAYPAQLAALRAALPATAGGLDGAERLLDITGKKSPRATLFEPLLMTLSRMRKLLNDSLAEFTAYKAKAASSSSSLSAPASASSSSSSSAPEKEEKKFSAGKAEKGKGRAPEASSSSSSSPSPSSSSSSKAEALKFPHKGKHCPPKWLVDSPKELATETAKSDQAALYLTSDPGTVLEWEQQARDEGFQLSGGFTVIHRFAFIVGADQGETTQCIRIDGDHGHPIIESGSKTSFDDYIKREIKTLRTAKNSARLRELADYLKGVGLSPATYKLTPAEVNWTAPSASSSSTSPASSSALTPPPAPTAED
jgi:hypothetical protein